MFIIIINIMIIIHNIQIQTIEDIYLILIKEVVILI